MKQINEKHMRFFKKKQEVNLDDFCRDFYEKNILNPMIGGVDAGAVYCDTVKRSIVEVDHNFANINSQTFAAEVVILRFELFALAWLHKFGDKLAVAQSTFTKHYLHEKKRDDIWDDSDSYNQAIARSSILGKTSKKAFDRVYLGRVFKARADLFDKYHYEGHDPQCVIPPLNRLFSEKAWKKGVTAGLLMFALCDRLGFEPNFEPNKEARFRLTAAIRGLYDGARQSLGNIKIKN
jgi:hypothetical protein